MVDILNRSNSTRYTPAGKILPGCTLEVPRPYADKHAGSVSGMLIKTDLWKEWVERCNVSRLRVEAGRLGVDIEESDDLDDLRQKVLDAPEPTAEPIDPGERFANWNELSAEAHKVKRAIGRPLPDDQSTESLEAWITDNWDDYQEQIRE